MTPVLSKAAYSGLLLCASIATAQTPFWPFADGASWELRSGRTTMRFDVTERAGDVYRVKWQNPWVKAEFGFRPESGHISLATLDMGSGVAPIPPGTVYFDFDHPRGYQWTNALGTMTILQIGSTVNTPIGSFRNCTEIRTRDSDKSDIFWTFCEGVGPVRVGPRNETFLLSAYHNGSREITKSDTRPEAPARTSAATPDARRAASPNRTLIGLDANPSASEGYSLDSQRQRMKLAIDSGVSFLYVHPKWDEVEKSQGQYDFSDLRFKIGLAQQFELPVLVNLRIIDTNNRAVPAPYKNWSFDDNRMAERLSAVLRSIAAETGSRVKWITIGNEVDQYFAQHKNEIFTYSRLIDRLLPLVHQLFPDALFTVNFTFSGWPRLNSDYGAISSRLDLFSFTYYPLNADLTMRDPGSVTEDLSALVRTAKGKPVILQEVGYASAARLHSSEQKQADFLRSTFEALRGRPEIVAANFLWMSDLPDSTVDQLTQYYHAGNSNNFKAYLGTLGYFDKQGRPKPAWHVFQSEASRR